MLQGSDEGCVPPVPRGPHLVGTAGDGEDRAVGRAGVPEGADGFDGDRGADRKQEAHPAEAAQRGDHRCQHPHEQRQEVGQEARPPGDAAPPVGHGIEHDLEDDADAHRQGEAALATASRIARQVPPGQDEEEQEG